MLVENRRQLCVVEGDKLFEGLLTVISHKERVMNVFHNSVQVDGLDIIIIIIIIIIFILYSAKSIQFKALHN